MKNNFKKNGNMRVRFETPEERTEIIRILEEQRGFRIDEDLKRLTKIHPNDTRTFDLNLKFILIEITDECVCVQFIRTLTRSDTVMFIGAYLMRIQWNK